MGRRRWEQRLSNLSPEERRKLQAGRQKAMQDPAVQAAHDKMRQAHKEFRDAMTRPCSRPIRQFNRFSTKFPPAIDVDLIDRKSYGFFARSDSPRSA